MNRLMGIVRSTIPYIKELMPYTDNNMPATILFQQAEYWFDKYSEGFYKFQTPCDHPAYKEGDSWCEELGITPKVFRNAWEKIGITYSSKKEMLEKGFKDDAGNEYFFCAYYDRFARLTTYYRNHAKVDALYEELLKSTPSSRKANNFNDTPSGSFRKCPVGVSGSDDTEFPEVPDGGFGKLPKGVSGSDQRESPEVTDGHIVYTDTTNQILQTDTTQITPIPPKGDRRTDDKFDLFWSLYPKKKSREAAKKAWAKLKAEQRNKAIEDLKERPDKDPDWKRSDGQFIPYPATYLNKGSYDDDWRVPETTGNDLVQRAKERIALEGDPVMDFSEPGSVFKFILGDKAL